MAEGIHVTEKVKKAWETGSHPGILILCTFAFLGARLPRSESAPPHGRGGGLPVTEYAATPALLLAFRSVYVERDFKNIALKRGRDSLCLPSLQRG